jgi:hypothetical protein
MHKALQLDWHYTHVHWYVPFHIPKPLLITSDAASSDINECMENACGSSATCENSIGDFKCGPWIVPNTLTAINEYTHDTAGYVCTLCSSYINE